VAATAGGIGSLLLGERWGTSIFASCEMTREVVRRREEQRLRRGSQW
jgi:hypothetical protein